MAQMQLQDFETELKSRGFDGFSNADLDRYINWGYRHIARRFPWYWEQTSSNFTLNTGIYTYSLNGFANFRALDFLIGVTANHRRTINPLTDHNFFTKWFPLDLTSVANQGEPSGYYVYENNLYVLPPPNSSRDFTAHYRRRMPDMANPGDSPLTPIHLDEAIVLAALIRCHKRANESQLALDAQSDLQEFFDDMYTDEELLMAQQPERVLPDDTWL